LPFHEREAEPGRTVYRHLPHFEPSVVEHPLDHPLPVTTALAFRHCEKVEQAEHRHFVLDARSVPEEEMARADFCEADRALMAVVKEDVERAVGATERRAAGDHAREALRGG
jgi:hypothetical protein